MLRSLTRDTNSRLIYINDTASGADAFVWKKVNQLGDLPKEREGHTVNAYNGKLYLFGGSTDHETHLSHNTVHSFNPGMTMRVPEVMRCWN